MTHPYDADRRDSWKELFKERTSLKVCLTILGHYALTGEDSLIAVNLLDFDVEHFVFFLHRTVYREKQDRKNCVASQKF